uniref:DUF2846 domain-containing protein n=1 Tax=Caulobacter sp. (strain K31) TaxID=366602 RepID=B0SZC6_CAUSK
MVAGPWKRAARFFNYRGVAAALLLAVFGGLSGPAQAGPPFPIKSNFKFDATSKYGLIVVLTAPQAQVKNYALGIYRYSPEERKWAYGPTKGWSRFGLIGENHTAPAYAITAVEPGGTYAINGLTVQGFWRACFNGGTKAFEVKPGTVTFIGLLDPNPSLEQIRTGLPPIVQTTKAVELFDLPRPALVAAADLPGGKEALAEYLKANYPQITAPIETPPAVDMTFDKSKTIMGTLCERY